MLGIVLGTKNTNKNHGQWVDERGSGKIFTVFLKKKKHTHQIKQIRRKHHILKC